MIWDNGKVGRGMCVSDIVNMRMGDLVYASTWRCLEGAQSLRYVQRCMEHNVSWGANRFQRRLGSKSCLR